jgi:plastocyanin
MQRIEPIHRQDPRSARPRRFRTATATLLALAAILGATAPARARVDLYDLLQVARPEAAPAASLPAGSDGPGRRNDPLAVPDIFGPGAVLSVGNVYMKVTNFGILGNPFTATSSDPSGQWPGSSSIEYLNAIALGVGAVNPEATDPNSVRRVSYSTEWRPATLDPEDKIYRGYDGIINGTRFVNDDGDRDILTDEPKIDEDFLDGRDNDGDGQIDEDHGALGQQQFSFVMLDNTIEAINTTRAEKHVPLGLEARVRSWAYSLAGFQDFNVAEFEIRNISGHSLDSLTIGWLVDMDAGPSNVSAYWLDDFDLPQYPSGEFTIRVGQNTGDLPDPLRAQQEHSTEGIQVDSDSALCPRVTLRINGFSTCDDNGDEGRTTGIGSFLLIDYTTDPTGASGPSDVKFRAFRSWAGAQPYQQGGNPRVDQERFEFMTGTDNIDPETGFVSLQTGETKGDYTQFVSVGPWLNVQNGQSIRATIAFAVQPGTFQAASRYPTRYAAYASHRDDAEMPAEFSGAKLAEDFPSLANALVVQIAFEGVHERREGYPVTNFHGRETPYRLPRGAPPATVTEDCSEFGRERREVLVNDREYSWFDFDCDFCTGVYSLDQGGLFRKTWNAAAPPPNPLSNVQTAYNFTDNPDRTEVPSGDKQVNLSWDNLSEITADPKSQWLDFRGYSVWKVSDWTRPVGSPGPSEADWKLVGEFRRFDYYTSDNPAGLPLERNYTRNPDGTRNCPMVYVPDPVDTTCYDDFGNRTGCRRPICMDRGDLWNVQSGIVLRPNWRLLCDTDTTSRGLPTPMNSGDIEFQGGSHETVFPNAGTFPYLCLRHPDHRGTVVVDSLGGGADSAVVTIDNAAAPFSPALVTIRKGGRVRWLNASDANHTVSSDRNCVVIEGCIVHRRGCENPGNRERRVDFPVGRYSFVDREVKNGFVYFYSVTAFDSTTDNSVTTQLGGRRSGVEAEGVVPEAVARDRAGSVWVVPNPYRGYARIAERPSSWDLIPNASDPTGTHVDFMGLPRGRWTIRIYTISGDLVQEIHSTDPVNESVRPAIRVGSQTYNGSNRQQDNPNDGQARWNLISRNGQDIVSGIYLFTVESDLGTQRGRFVVIR